MVRWFRLSVYLVFGFVCGGDTKFARNSLG
jgi:hypothetical protein